MLLRDTDNIAVDIDLQLLVDLVPVIEPAFQAALMPGGREPPLVPLRGRAAVIPTVDLPTVAGPAEGEHRPAPRPAAPHLAPQPSSGSHAGPPRRRRRVRRRRGVTGGGPTGVGGRRRARAGRQATTTPRASGVSASSPEVLKPTRGVPTKRLPTGGPQPTSPSEAVA